MTRPIKTILVSLNNSQFLENNMAMAAQIARRYNSHIIGLYVIPSVIVYAAPYGYGGPMNFTHMNRFYKSKASQVEQNFRDYVAKEALNGEWRKVDSLGHFISDSILEHGREADLVILGNDNSLSTDDAFDGRIVRELGRPVLLVPNTHQSDFSFKKAVVAWDGSREASRAAFDAVPLLQMAGKTEVTCFNPHREREISGDVPGTALAEALSRYDIKAETVSEKTKKSVGRALMDRAETGDLLVMGAYGHTRLRENIFGGVTRKALSRMPCPILMSN